jgi:cytochrome c oxidase assembly protein Cox11
VIVVLGVSYAAVPLYRIFCQVDCISCFYYLCY